MTVFRGYVRIIKRNLNSIIMYVAIFMTICIVIQNAMANSGMTDGFSSMKMNVAVIDRDGGVVADTLKALMERDQKVVEIEDDAQVMQEELYYGNVEYILIVPEGAEEKLRQGEACVESITDPGTYSAYYAQAQVTNLLNQIRVCLASGMELEEACKNALAMGENEAKVTLLDVNGNAGLRPDYNYFFAYLPYAFLGATIMTMSLILMEFKKKEIRSRMQSSAVPFWKQILSMVAAFLIVGMLIWAIFLVIQTILYQGGIFTSGHVMLYLLNSLACILVAQSLGFFTGTVANGSGALNGMNNVISLGLCFLGGIFVPLEMLGDGVTKVSQFLPTYWYSVVNGLLGDYAVLGSELIGTVWMGLLIQVLFAAAIFALTLIIRRRQIQEA